MERWRRVAAPCGSADDFGTQGKGTAALLLQAPPNFSPPPNSPRNERQDQCRPPPLHMPGKRLRRKQCGMCVKHFLAIILNKTVWPSGLRRWLQAPVRKGVGSNPTAVKFHINAFLSVLALSPTLQMPARRAGQAVNPMSVHTRGGSRQSNAAQTFARWAHGVVVSHPLSMREALGSIPSVSIFSSPHRRHPKR